MLKYAEDDQLCPVMSEADGVGWWSFPSGKTSRNVNFRIESSTTCGSSDAATSTWVGKYKSLIQEFYRIIFKILFLLEVCSFDSF
ncbi:hypothetical protein V1477_017865 [Vespula maculifrons]|uniref:Uncharacterized protein n=1 Tax=Vespula maculifrons TaxID=7453 RepID=A0ABD2B0B8_VESMC